MLTSGDVVDLDLGRPAGREAGYVHPGVVVTAQRILAAGPAVLHVVPLTTTLRGFGTDVVVEPDARSGLTRRSAAQCQHIRAVSTERVEGIRGNVGPAVLAEIRDVLGHILDVVG